MLQIILMILKVLGILLLVILGIAVAFLLAVLFVPVRYGADVSFDGRPEGSVRLSWFLHLITVHMNYDGSVKTSVKVLWFRLFDKTDRSSEGSQEQAEDQERPKDIPTVKNAPSEPVEAKPVKTRNSVSEKKSRATGIDDSVSEKKSRAAGINDSVSETKSEVTDIPAEHTESEKTPWMVSAIETVVSLVQKMIQKIRCTYHQLYDKADAGQKKLSQVRSFLKDEENQKTFRLLWKQIIKLFRHIFPRKMAGRVRFGFEDPATTGQILTYISPFYSLYAKTLEIEPVFGEKVAEGELRVKGYIRVASLLWMIIRVFLNKNFRTLIKKFMKNDKK